MPNQGIFRASAVSSMPAMESEVSPLASERFNPPNVVFRYSRSAATSRPTVATVAGRRWPSLRFISGVGYQEASSVRRIGAHTAGVVWPTRQLLFAIRGARSGGTRPTSFAHLVYHARYPRFATRTRNANTAHLPYPHREAEPRPPARQWGGKVEDSPPGASSSDRERDRGSSPLLRPLEPPYSAATATPRFATHPVANPRQIDVDSRDARDRALPKILDHDKHHVRKFFWSIKSNCQ